MLKILPTMIALSQESVLEKNEFYKTTFNLSQNEFNKMFKNLPTLIALSQESVLEKKKNFDKVGITSQQFVDNASILNCPSNSFIFKYMLFYIQCQNNKFLSKKGWSITSGEKLWARYCFLKSQKNVKDLDISFDEKKTYRKYHANSTELMLKYPITEDVIEYVNNAYNEIAYINGDKPLSITYESIQKTNKSKERELNE